MTNETNVKQSIKDMDFNMAVDLLADENVRKAVKKSNTVEVNGFKILYSTPNEIFIIKDNNVIARINESSKTFYRSTLAPLAGREVYLEDNLLIYNNHNNTFIDYNIDGIDVIEANYLDILNTKPLSTSTKIPNTAIVNQQVCTVYKDSSRSACCGKVGYVFTFEKGWEKQQKMTEKCQYH